MNKFAIKTAATLTALIPAVALAQTPPTKPITTAAGITTLLDTIAGWMFAIFLALAVIFLIYAAFLYLTAAGNEGKVSSARNALIYSVVAIVVAVVAGGVPQIVCSLLKTSCA